MQYAAMFSNPMMLSASGAKMETIKGQRVTVEFRSGADNGTIKAVVDGRYLVEFEGDSVTVRWSFTEHYRIEAIDHTDKVKR